MKILPSKDIKKFCEKITNAGKILLVSHLHPDGDAAGSCVAMLSWLRDRGLEAAMVLPQRQPDCLDFLFDGLGDGDVIVSDLEPERAAEAVRESGLIIFLDMNSADRAGDALAALLEASPAERILIDHHPEPERERFSLCFSDTEVSSASELLYYILKAVSGSASALPPLASLALMTGMTTDTNNFANSVFPSTFEMASDLLAAGVDRDGVVARVFNSYRIERLRLMGRLLDKGLRTVGDGAAYMILTRDLAAEFDIKDGETEGFVNLPLSVADIRLSLFLTEEEDRFRVSIRSKRGVRANALSAKYFHGGGHEMAAGGKLPVPDDVGDAAEAAAYVEKAVTEFLNESDEPE